MFISFFSNGDLADGLLSALKFAYLQSKETLIEGYFEAMDFLSLSFANIAEIFTGALYNKDAQLAIYALFSSIAALLRGALFQGAEAIFKALGQMDAAKSYGQSSKNQYQASEDFMKVAQGAFENIDFSKIAKDMGTGITGAAKEAQSNQEKGFNKVFGSQEGIDKAWNDMMGIGNRAFVKAEELFKKTKEDNDPLKGSFQQPGTGKVIADSLAKVGGGGGFLRVGMTLTERTAVESLKAQKESNEIQKRIENNTSKGEKPTTMVR